MSKPSPKAVAAPLRLVRSDPQVTAVPRPEAARIAELDGIRGIAVLAVVFYHLLFWSQQGAGQEWTGLPLMLWKLSKEGWTGVHLFFILSGFLITGILLNAKGQPHYFRNFYGRRVLRIFPAYFATLLAVYFVFPASGSFVLLSGAFLSNMTPLFGVPMVYGSLWTLAVEEHFYIAWPWVVGRFGRETLKKIIVGLLLLGPVLRGLRITFGWEEAFYSWYGFDSLLWGAVLALLYDNGKIAKKTLLRFSLGCLALGVFGFVAGGPFGLLSRKTFVGTVFQLPCMDFVILGFIGAVLASQGKAWTATLRSRPLTTFGTLSYSLYLVHCLVIHGVNLFLEGREGLIPFPAGTFGYWVVAAAVGFALSCLVSVLSYRFIESPALRYRHHFKS